MTNTERKRGPIRRAREAKVTFSSVKSRNWGKISNCLAPCIRGEYLGGRKSARGSDLESEVRQELRADNLK